MNKPYTQEQLVDGLNKTLAEQYQRDRNSIFDPKFDVQSIKDHFQELLNSYTRDKKEAQNTYVPALKEDIVFGDDKWSARERFLNQKKQLYSALCAYEAKDTYDEAVAQLEQAINEVNTPSQGEASADGVPPPRAYRGRGRCHNHRHFPLTSI